MADSALKDTVSQVLRGHERILLGYLFGSIARGEAAEGSDLDLALYAAGPLDLEERARIAEEVGRALGFERKVDVVDLRSASPVLAAEVVRDGQRLIERDPLIRFDFEMDAIRRFEDTRPLRRLQQDLLREAARGAT